MKKRGLGRSLETILSSSALLNAVDTPAAETSLHDGIKHLPVTELKRGQYQPRQTMDEAGLEELANSIKSQGVLQPIIVRALDEQCYEIIAGERRWRASQLAGLTEVPVIIKDIPDEQAVAIALIENIQRENLNPVEEAIALQRLLDEFDMTHQEVADAVGRSRTAVSNLLRLLNLHPQVRTFLEHGDIEMGHARALLGLEPEKQVQAAEEVVDKGLTVRQTEKYVRDLQKGKTVKLAAPKKPEDPDVIRLQQTISDRLNAKVRIQHKTNGKGRLVISYTSLEELDGILDRMQ